MSIFSPLRFLFLALAALSVCIIVAFSPLLSGSETAAARYAEITIPFGKNIVFLTAVYLIIIGLLHRKRSLTLQLPIIIMTLLLVFLWCWGRLSSIVTAREFSQFDFFILMSVTGLIVGSSNARNIIELGIAFSASLIAFSIFTFGSMPEALGPLSVYDREILERVGTGGGIFFRNSGILLNNNTAGSVMSILFACLMYQRQLRTSCTSVDYTTLIILIAILLSGNATATALCLPLYFYSLITCRSMSSKLSYLPMFAIVLILIASAVIAAGYDYDYFDYKLESLGVKVSIFMSTFSVFFDGFLSILFGHRDPALLSESTLIDFIYYFGLPGLIVLIFIVIFGVTGTSGHRGLLGNKVSSAPPYIILFALLIVQNSVLIPPVSFLFGLILAYSHRDLAASHAK
jgi:hypothetical protein